MNSTAKLRGARAPTLCWLFALMLTACGSSSSVGREDSPARCGDGADNDQDGFADCEDQDCQALPECSGGDGDADADADTDGDTDTDGDADGELCNGLDDDGDDAIDEGNPGSGVACLTGLAGRCEQGRTTCMAGEIVCEPSVLPEPESCANEGEDDDCNGRVDDIEGLDEPCDTGLGGACAAGTGTCVGDSLACVPDSAQPEGPCANGEDDDCDGEVDEDANPQPEDCTNPGVDDDCNGVVDDVPGRGIYCDSGNVGLCRFGFTGCVGQEMGCVPNNEPSQELCDNDRDEDCDGETDELDCISPYLHHTGYGQEWIDDDLTGTYDRDRALRTCLQFAATQEGDWCSEGPCGCQSADGFSACQANTGDGAGQVSHAWYYSGPLAGLSSEDATCDANIPWD